ncbi:MAG: SDR family NAD(P)-dependent oxidoreductase [Kiloniellales bacterium]
MQQPAPPDSLALPSFGDRIRVALIGASGGIGSALADSLESCSSVSRVIRLSRKPDSLSDDRLALDLEDEASIAAAAKAIKSTVGDLHLVIVASGLLHRGEGLQPEKTWRNLSAAPLEAAFRINTIGPALVAKHFLPLLARERKTAFAALSARVGSITDNELGGWYAYRASKAALNMLIKTLAIELARRNPDAVCVGLHPGTVDSALSKPFQRGVPAKQLFSPQRSARHLLQVLDGLQPDDSGGLFAWDGQRIPF